MPNINLQWITNIDRTIPLRHHYRKITLFYWLSHNYLYVYLNRSLTHHCIASKFQGMRPERWHSELEHRTINDDVSSVYVHSLNFYSEHFFHEAVNYKYYMYKYTGEHTWKRIPDDHENVANNGITFVFFFLSLRWRYIRRYKNYSMLERAEINTSLWKWVYRTRWFWFYSRPGWRWRCASLVVWLYEKISKKTFSTFTFDHIVTQILLRRCIFDEFWVKEFWYGLSREF